jgi:hypothetical protein
VPIQCLRRADHALFAIIGRPSFKEFLLDLTPAKGGSIFIG